MEIQEYIEKKIEIQTIILDLIDSEENIEENIQFLIDLLDSQNIQEDKNEFIAFIRMLNKISKNHNRPHKFFYKIERILQHFKDSINQIFTNTEIFNFFKGNKRILLFLIEEKIITVDEFIINIMKSDKYLKYNYLPYFFTEIESFIDESMKEKIKESLEYAEPFEERRKDGENDDRICELIQKDSIEEFISYINRINYKLSSTIKPSIFETNSFLLKNDATLIEYSAFYGSIQIFKFLFMNKVELKPSLWLYVIHGRNPELIHFLEDNHIKPNDPSYKECLNESLKCHHHELTTYIQNNLYSNPNENDFYLFSKSYKYFNYMCFPKDLKSEYVFYDLCQYNYIKLVQLLLNTTNVDINFKVIFKLLKFLNNVSYFV